MFSKTKLSKSKANFHPHNFSKNWFQHLAFSIQNLFPASVPLPILQPLRYHMFKVLAAFASLCVREVVARPTFGPLSGLKRTKFPRTNLI
jgi:hypothetical protein